MPREEDSTGKLDHRIFSQASRERSRLTHAASVRRRFRLACAWRSRPDSDIETRRKAQRKIDVMRNVAQRSNCGQNA
jgi:hypothetical protein